jgi:hypothetical protein
VRVSKSGVVNGRGGTEVGDRGSVFLTDIDYTLAQRDGRGINSHI